MNRFDINCYGNEHLISGGVDVFDFNFFFFKKKKVWLVIFENVNDFRYRLQMATTCKMFHDLCWKTFSSFSMTDFLRIKRQATVSDEFFVSKIYQKITRMFELLHQRADRLQNLEFNNQCIYFPWKPLEDLKTKLWGAFFKLVFSRKWASLRLFFFASYPMPIDDFSKINVDKLILTYNNSTRIYILPLPTSLIKLEISSSSNTNFVLENLPSRLQELKVNHSGLLNALYRLNCSNLRVLRIDGCYLNTQSNNPASLVNLKILGLTSCDDHSASAFVSLLPKTINLQEFAYSPPLWGRLSKPLTWLPFANVYDFSTIKHNCSDFVTQKIPECTAVLFSVKDKNLFQNPPAHYKFVASSNDPIYLTTVGDQFIHGNHPLARIIKLPPEPFSVQELTTTYKLHSSLFGFIFNNQIFTKKDKTVTPNPIGIESFVNGPIKSLNRIFDSPFADIPPEHVKILQDLKFISYGQIVE